MKGVLRCGIHLDRLMFSFERLEKVVAQTVELDTGKEACKMNPDIRDGLRYQKEARGRLLVLTGWT